MPSSAAQDEFNSLIYGNSSSFPSGPHPEDQREQHSAASSSPSSPLSTENRRGPGINRSTQRDSEGEDSDGEDNMTKTRTRYYIPKLRADANTGPKGVIADAQAFEQARRALRFTGAAGAQQTSIQVQQPYSSYLNSEKPRNVDDLENEDDHDDEGFMHKWRQNRLNELQNGPRSGKLGASGGRWGNLVAVDAEGYLDAIEKVAKDTVVVVFIYDDTSEVSDLIEIYVRELARQNPSTRFVKLHYEEAEMEPAGVPALLAYKGGDKFAGLVPIMDEIPEEEELDTQSLGMVMRRHAILP